MNVTVRIETPGSQLRDFRHWWCKRIDAFNPAEHCIKCFRGSVSQVFKIHMPVNRDVEIEYGEGDYIYFCGVAYDWNWSHNMHLAGIGSPGETSEVRMFNGDWLVVKGMRQLPFNDKVALQHYDHLGHKFTTCRNFQFGAQMAHAGLIPFAETKKRPTKNRDTFPMLF